ncbi:Fic family protein [Catenulispora subtropica]|uniref:Fido domain-containing protein n=1 Tax=Catenulispora subtropica TaxID=450798 RepID=A0ABN2RYR0_9ACTN
MLTWLYTVPLVWDDVDPARHPFDSGTAASAIAGLGPALRSPRRPDGLVSGSAEYHRFREEADLWTDAMTFALVERFGVWALGWTHRERDGGPVWSWCCTADSVTTPEETLERVVAAVGEWREWVEGLAWRFEAYPLDLAAIEEQRILWERTARSLILRVIDRTGCSGGWYGLCHQVLRWFLMRWGVSPAAATVLVEDAVGPRFHSWVRPEPLVVDEIAEQLAGSLEPGHGAWPVGTAADHLQRWLDVRESVPWHEAMENADAADVAGAPLVPARDGAAACVDAFDAVLDPDRGRGLLAALERVRADAARGADLDFELLRGWQQQVLGTPEPPEFRRYPAFAKHGRERYGIGPDTRARFDACLAESGSGPGALPLAARAARTYLDVCFFHPFDDGNARSAFLALVFVLAREEVALDDVVLLRHLPVRAGETDAAVGFAWLVLRAMAETRRRAA